MALSPDGHTLATGSGDTTARLWETNVDRVAARICSITPTITPSEWNHYLPDLAYHPLPTSYPLDRPPMTRAMTSQPHGVICVFGLDCPDRLTHSQAESLTCLQWVNAGIALGGPQGVDVLDLARP